MEYDPASPTDEYEEKGGSADVYTIPLPDAPTDRILGNNGEQKVENIPLPPTKAQNLGSIPMPPDIPQNNSSLVTPPTTTSNHNNADDALLSFRIKSTNKRSRPAILRTGVLPTKPKHPEVETKTELFKPTKEDELEVMAEISNDLVYVNQMPSQPSLTAISEAILARISTAAQSGQDLAAALRDVNKLTHLHGLVTQSAESAHTHPMESKNEITKPDIAVEEVKLRPAHVGVTSTGQPEVEKRRSQSRSHKNDKSVSRGRSQTPPIATRRESRSRSHVSRKKAPSPPPGRRSSSKSSSHNQSRRRRSSSRISYHRSRKSCSSRVSRSPIIRRRHSLSSRRRCDLHRRSSSPVIRRRRDRTNSRIRHRRRTGSVSSDCRGKRRDSFRRRISVDRKAERHKSRNISKRQLHSRSSSSPTQSSSRSSSRHSISRRKTRLPLAKRSRESESPKQKQRSGKRRTERRLSESTDPKTKSLSSSKLNKVPSKPEFKSSDAAAKKKKESKPTPERVRKGKSKGSASKYSSAKPPKSIDTKLSIGSADSSKKGVTKPDKYLKVDDKKSNSSVTKYCKATSKSTSSKPKTGCKEKKHCSSSSEKKAEEEPNSKREQSNTTGTEIEKIGSSFPVKTLALSESKGDTEPKTIEASGDSIVVIGEVSDHGKSPNDTVDDLPDIPINMSSGDGDESEAGGGAGPDSAVVPPHEPVQPPSMTLDDPSTNEREPVGGIPTLTNNNSARNKNNDGKTSYCSTASTSCHTPLSGSSTSSSINSNECSALSPNRLQGASEQRRRRTVPPASAYEGEEDESNGDDDSSSNSRYRLRQRRTLITSGGGTPMDEAPTATPLDVYRLLQPTQLPPIHHFVNLAGVSCPQYQHVTENDYSLIDEQLRREGIDPETDTHLLRHHGGGGDWVCDCALPCSGELACGHGCINRAVYIECGSRCRAHSLCSNRQFQLCLYAPSEPYYCGPQKGWGLRARQTIPKGAFIVEYAGEVIDFPEFRRRIRFYEKARRLHHYFMALGPAHFIDAGTKGNWARFVNHSCEPNCETQKWVVNGRIRIGFFALTDILPNEEITIDYQFVQYGLTQQKCYCGTPSCLGIMGATSKSLQDKVRLKDTRAVERRIVQLLSGKTLQTAEDVTFLIQVMVQEYLTRNTRLELLKLLANTDNDSYLKLFRQYNGLELLASYMCDTAPADWEIKNQILVCLEHIPVSEQKQVQTDSSLMAIVRQWTLDPHYSRCRDDDAANCLEITDAPKVTKGYAEQSEVVNIVDVTTPTAESAQDTVANEGVMLLVPQGGSTDTSRTNSFTANGTSEIPKGPIDTGAPPPALIRENDESVKEDVEVKSDCSGALRNQLLDANTVRVYSAVEEEAIIRNIRQLASQIFYRWSKLPVETYRIPRLEREATEQSILQSSGSALVSWGTSQKDDSFASWNILSKNSKSNESPNLGLPSSTGLHPPIKSNSSGNRQNRNRTSGYGKRQKLTRSQYRAQFEADMRAAEVTAASSSVVVGGSGDSKDDCNQQKNPIHSVSKMLVKNLSEKLSESGSVQFAMAALSDKMCEFAERNDTEGLVAYLQSLADETNAAMGNKPVSRADSPTSATITAAANGLKTHWCSAVDATTGQTYYYNSVTSVVQWHPPPPISPTTRLPIKLPVPSPRPHNILPKKDFLSEVYMCVIKLLKPFRLPNCLTGRIDSDDDMKYIAKKFTLAFWEKEKTRFQEQVPQLTRETVERFRRKITRYLTSKGRVYVRSTRLPHQSRPTTDNNSNTTSLDWDMEIGDD